MCGACTVLLDGVAVRACLVFAVQANSCVITTIEGVADEDGGSHPVQDAMSRAHGLQCGFCTPGMVMSIIALLERNPDPDDREIREGLSGNLCRCTGYQGIVDAVRIAVRSNGVTNAEQGRPAVALGHVVRRTEDRRLLTGHGQYVDDVRLPGTLQVAFVRSPFPRADIVDIDVSAAERFPGVRAAYTPADLNHLARDMRSTIEIFATSTAPPFRELLASAQVRYVGDPVVMIVADSRYIAEDAAELVDITYAELPPVIGLDAALRDEHIVQAELGTNIAATLSSPPDPRVDDAFAEATFVLDETFEQHRLAEEQAAVAALSSAAPPAASPPRRFSRRCCTSPATSWRQPSRT